MICYDISKLEMMYLKSLRYTIHGIHYTVYSIRYLNQRDKDKNTSNKNKTEGLMCRIHFITLMYVIEWEVTITYGICACTHTHSSSNF